MWFVSTSVSSLPGRAIKVSSLYLSLGFDRLEIGLSDIGEYITKRCVDWDICERRYQSLLSQLVIGSKVMPFSITTALSASLKPL